MWARADSVVYTRGGARETDNMGTDLVTWRQPRVLVPLDSSAVGRRSTDTENEYKVALAQLESRFECALLRQAEDFKSQLQQIRAETEEKVAVLKQEIKEGMDRSLGDIYTTLSRQGDAIDKVTNAVGYTAQETKEALAESARKQDEMGAILAGLAQFVMGPTSRAPTHGPPSMSVPDPPLHSSAPTGCLHDMSDRGSLERLSTTPVSHPPSPPQVYHVVEAERHTIGELSADPVEHGRSVELDSGISSPHGRVSAPSATLGAVSTHEPSRRPGRGPSSTESSKRAPAPHSQLPPSQRADTKPSPRLGPVVGSGDTVAFKDDGNPSTGAGADNPGGSLFSLH